MTSQAQLTVDLPPPPVITQQPNDTTAEQGTTVSFVAQATGIALEYQWFFGTSKLNGQTNAELTLPNVSTNQTGVYTVTITNPSGVTVTSREARLTVTLPTPPVINQQPADLTVDLGASASFHVQASGTPPLHYQWFFGFGSLPGETNATLALLHVTTNQAGTYRVLVQNPTGIDVFSRAATLTVSVPPPPVNERLLLGLSRSGQNIVLSWPASAVGFSLEVTERLGAPTWNRCRQIPCSLAGITR